MSGEEENTILACPVCDSYRACSSNDHHNRTDVATDYYCCDCGARFDEPTVRPRKRGGDGPKHGLAKTLDDASPEDLGLGAQSPDGEAP